MEQQLPVIDRLAKARFERQTFRGNCVHVSGVKLIAVTTGILRSVESRSGVFQQSLAIPAIRRKETDSHARGSEELLPVQIEGRFQHFANCIGDFEHINGLAN